MNKHRGGHRWKGALLSPLLFLSVADQSRADGTGWLDAVPIDSGGGGYATISYSPSGDMRVFYSVTGATERMVVRLRRAGETAFGPETFVYNGARSASAHYPGGPTVDLAVANSALVIALVSTNGGANWTFQKSYSGGNNTFTFPCYLPLALTEDGADLRLLYGYQYDSGIFGASGRIYQTMRTNSVWMATGSLIDDGDVCGAVETGEIVTALGTRGVLLSTNDGASYTTLGESDPIPDQLRASDMAVGEDGRLYLLHGYSYGVAPNDQHLTFTRSDDHGATWTSPQKEILTRGDYIFSPRFAVDGQRMVVVWQHAVIPNQHQYVQMTMSEDGGETWSPAETIVSLTGSDTMNIGGVLDLAIWNGRVSLVYAVENGSTRLGLYLKERLLDTPRVGNGGATAENASLVFTNLAFAATNIIQRSPDLLDSNQWTVVGQFVPMGRATNWTVPLTGTIDRGFYRLRADL